MKRKTSHAWVMWRSNSACLVVGAALAFPAAPSLAQNSAASDGAAIEAIIVTAQRKEESLQATPLAVSAFSKANLDQLNIRSANDIARFTPNMLAEKQPGASGTTNYSIRGITQGEPSLSVDPGVGVYLNGVYVARNNALAADFVDVERIEVLRGPQGTLYGRNSSGGAINIITARPTGEFKASARMGIGNYGQFRTVLSVDTPEYHNLSAKIAYMRNKSGGYVRNLTTDYQQGKAKDFGAIDQHAIYGALNWTSGDVIVDYQFDWSDSRNMPAAFQITHANVNQARGFVDSVFGAGFFDSPGGAAIRQTYENAESLANSKKRIKELNLPYAGREKGRISGHALTAEWNVNDALSVKSITGYRKMKLISLTDFSGGASAQSAGGQWIALFAGGGDAPLKKQDQFSQELQLFGDYGDLDFVTGLYYFKENGESSGSSQVSVNMGYWGPNEASDIQNAALAAYGQLSWHVNDRIDVTAGLRYTRDSRKLAMTNFDRAAGQFISRDFSKKFNNVSGAASVSYAFDDDIRTYFRVATGYKSGGFLDRIDPTAQRPFKSETLVSYELGFKADLLDRALRFNTALFYSVYDDLQVSQFVPSSRGDQSIISNAGKASYKGAEVEITAIPFRNLLLNVTYGYLDPKYKKYEFFDPTGQYCGSPRISCDVSDRAHFPTAPRHTAAGGIQYDFKNWSFANLQARADVTYNSGYLHGTIDSPSDRWVKARAHTLVSGKLTLSDVRLGGRAALELSLWGRNLTNTSYVSYGIGAFDALGFAGGIFNEPRTYGAEAIIRF